jgi:phosphoglycolate phosphatase
MENHRKDSTINLAFDMDGVIYSAENFIAGAYETAIKNSGISLHFPDTDDILMQIGKPVTEIFRELFGELSEKQMNVLLSSTRKTICEMIKEDKGSIFDGIPEIISRLSEQYSLSVCSNAGIQYIETILEHYKLKQFFNPVLTLETTGAKDKNELLGTYIHNSNSDASGWIMIGDRSTDLYAAQYNHCSFIGCLWGHGNIEELEGSDVIIENPGSLIKAVKKV